MMRHKIWIKFVALAGNLGIFELVSVPELLLQYQ